VLSQRTKFVQSSFSKWSAGKRSAGGLWLPRKQNKGSSHDSLSVV
jgi:hypothetical protein